MVPTTRASQTCRGCPDAPAAGSVGTMAPPAPPASSTGTSSVMPRPPPPGPPVRRDLKVNNSTWISPAKEGRREPKSTGAQRSLDLLVAPSPRGNQAEKNLGRRLFAKGPRPETSFIQQRAPLSNRLYTPRPAPRRDGGPGCQSDTLRQRQASRHARGQGGADAARLPPRWVPPELDLRIHVTELHRPRRRPSSRPSPHLPGGTHAEPPASIRTQASG